MEVLASMNRMSAITFLSFYFSSKNGTGPHFLTILVWHITTLMDLLLHISSLPHFYCCLRYQFGSRWSLFVTDYIFIDGSVFCSKSYTTLSKRSGDFTCWLESATDCRNQCANCRKLHQDPASNQCKPHHH